MLAVSLYSQGELATFLICVGLLIAVVAFSWPTDRRIRRWKVEEHHRASWAPQPPGCRVIDCPPPYDQDEVLGER